MDTDYYTCYLLIDLCKNKDTSPIFFTTIFKWKRFFKGDIWVPSLVMWKSELYSFFRGNLLHCLRDGRKQELISLEFMPKPFRLLKINTIFYCWHFFLENGEFRFEKKHLNLLGLFFKIYWKGNSNLVSENADNCLTKKPIAPTIRRSFVRCANFTFDFGG